MKTLSVDLIKKAAQYIQKHIRKTPLEYSPKLSEHFSVPVWLKLEFLQITGSFKLRGALFRLSCLTEKERKSGIVVCSTGNHGKAVAYVAHMLGIHATVYVPRDVDHVKYQGILDYGAEVIRSPFVGYDETEDLARKAAEESGRPLIGPCDDVETMAGNGGTLAQEIIEELPDARSFILPVGGGGLSAGFSVYAKELIPDCHIIACQHKDSPGLKLSLERGHAVTRLPPIQTLAGGIEGGIDASCFPYLQSRIDEVLVASEQEIIEGVRWMLEHHQYLIEPTAAVTIGACLYRKIEQLIPPVVIVLSGRNVSFATIQKILCEKL